MSTPYVREVGASKSDIKKATETLTRAFADDPAFNWYGGVDEKSLVTDLKNPNANARKTLANLRDFFSAMLKVTLAFNGVVTAVAIPSSETGGEERLGAVCLWLRPDTPANFPFFTMMRAGGMAIAWNWGIRGLNRIQREFLPAVEKSLAKAFKARNLKPSESWYLFMVVVDPDFQGQGFCSRLMEDGFKRTSPLPVHLEATTAKSKDIYAKYGFEINDEHVFGKGAVDSRGVTAKGEKATGYPEWIMTKWTS